MLTDRADGLMRISRTTKYALTAASVSIPALLISGSGTAVQVSSTLTPAAIVFLGLMAFGPDWRRWTQCRLHRPLSSALRITAIDWTLTAAGLIAGHSLMSVAAAVSTPVLPVVLTTAPLLLLLNRHIPEIVRSVLFRGAAERRVLLLGSSVASNGLREHRMIARWLGMTLLEPPAASSLRRGLRLFDPDEVSSDVDMIQQLPELVLHSNRSLAVEHVVYVQEDPTGDGRLVEEQLREQCAACGVQLTIYSDQERFPAWSPEAVSLNAPPIGSHPETPLQNPANRVVKRCLDVAISLPVVVLILPPLCLLVRMMHRSQSPGPLFYRQQRCGLNGQQFQILKFRTMHVPPPGETDIEDNPAPRIFSLGGLLRDSRLDEIPQFVNVLAGQMSVVGPRAHHAQDRKKFSAIVPHYPMRMQAKPGITGLAQYREYRGLFEKDNVADRVDCDLKYIVGWTFETDLTLMVRTAHLIASALLDAVVSGLRTQPETISIPSTQVGSSGQPTTGRHAA